MPAESIQILNNICIKMGHERALKEKWKPWDLGEHGERSQSGHVTFLSFALCHLSLEEEQKSHPNLVAE